MHSLLTKQLCWFQYSTGKKKIKIILLLMVFPYSNICYLKGGIVSLTYFPVIMLWGGSHFECHIWGDSHFKSHICRWAWAFVPADLVQSFGAICTCYCRSVSYCMITLKSAQFKATHTEWKWKNSDSHPYMIARWLLWLIPPLNFFGSDHLGSLRY